MTIAVGERIPEAILSYVPYAPELDDLVCGAHPNLSSSSTHASDRASLPVGPVRTIAKPTRRNSLTADPQSPPTPLPKSGLERRSWSLPFPARSLCDLV